MFWLGGDFWVSSSLSSVGDPDLQIRGRGRGGHPDPEIGGGGWAVFKKLGKNFGRKIRWGGGGAGPRAPPQAPPPPPPRAPPLDPPLLFQSESRPCEAIAMKMIISVLMQIKWNPFSLERFCTKPCFESEFLDFVKWSIEHLLHDSTCWHQSIYLLKETKLILMKTHQLSCLRRQSLLFLDPAMAVEYLLAHGWHSGFPSSSW